MPLQKYPVGLLKKLKQAIETWKLRLLEYCARPEYFFILIEPSVEKLFSNRSAKLDAGAAIFTNEMTLVFASSIRITSV